MGNRRFVKKSTVRSDANNVVKQFNGYYLAFKENFKHYDRVTKSLEYEALYQKCCDANVALKTDETATLRDKRDYLFLSNYWDQARSGRLQYSADSYIACYKWCNIAFNYFDEKNKKDTTPFLTDNELCDKLSPVLAKLYLFSRSLYMPQNKITELFLPTFNLCAGYALKALLESLFCVDNTFFVSSIGMSFLSHTLTSLVSRAVVDFLRERVIVSKAEGFMAPEVSTDIIKQLINDCGVKYGIEKLSATINEIEAVYEDAFSAENLYRQALVRGLPWPVISACSNFATPTWAKFALLYFWPSKAVSHVFGVTALPGKIVLSDPRSAAEVNLQVRRVLYNGGNQTVDLTPKEIKQRIIQALLPTSGKSPAVKGKLLQTLTRLTQGEQARSTTDSSTQQRSDEGSKTPSRSLLSTFFSTVKEIFATEASDKTQLINYGTTF